MRAPAPAPTPPGGRLPAATARGATYGLLALPVLLALGFVHRFAVNTPYWDQWAFVPVVVRYFDGGLRLADLTARHNEHRGFFARLLMLGLAGCTNYSNLAEAYANVVLLAAGAAVLLRAHVRAFGAGTRSLLAFAPVPWLLLSWRQFENLLWGWQLHVTLCALACIASLCLLDGVTGIGRRWLGAAAAGWRSSAVATGWRRGRGRSPSACSCSPAASPRWSWSDAPGSAPASDSPRAT